MTLPSYRLHEDEGKTASWAGNSPDMIHAHYRALMSAKDAKGFFEIVPGPKGGVARATARKAKGKIAELSEVMEEQGTKKANVQLPTSNTQR